MAGLGDEFRATREARHLSLSDVAENLHIRSVYLQSIEDEDWSVIGAPVYVRGFIRSYARFLGLDPETYVERYNMQAGAIPHGSRSAAPAVESTFVSRARTGRRGASPVLWLAVIAAAVLVGFVGYNVVALRGGLAAVSHVAVDSPAPAVSDATAIAAPRATETPTAPKPAVASRKLEVVLTATSWLLVTIDGKKQLEGTFPAGTMKSFRGKVADVRAGNAGGVRLQVNGKVLGAMGHDGDVVQRRLALIEE